MRFHIISYDNATIDTASVHVGNSYNCILPRYPQMGPWDDTPHSWGMRYNQVLMYELARCLVEHGHAVTGEAAGPPTNPPEIVAPFSSDGITTTGVYNCDVLSIRNMETNQFCVIDMQDYPSFSRQWSASENCLAVYMTMYEREWVAQHTAAPDKYRPFLYFAMHPEDTEAYASQQKTLPVETATDLRLFFAGTLGDTGSYTYTYTDAAGNHYPWREVAIHLQQLAPDEVVVWGRNEKLPRDAWWKVASQHRWNLFLAGGPWCNREHELWTLGCATIGFEYSRHPFMEPITPNVEYAAVTAPEGTDNVGRPINPERAAKELLRRYREVRDDHTFAKQLVKNARNRMMRVAAPRHAARRILRECWGIGNPKYPT